MLPKIQSEKAEKGKWKRVMKMQGEDRQEIPVLKKATAEEVESH